MSSFESFRPETVKNYEDLKDQFLTWDADGNGRLSATEFPANEDFRNWDKDQNGTIEIYETMTAINEAAASRGVSALFRPEQVQSLETAARLTEVSDMPPKTVLTVTETLASLLDAGIPESDLKKIMELVSDVHDWELQSVLQSVASLKEQGFNSKQIGALLVGVLPDSLLATNKLISDLPAAVEKLRGLSFSPDQILALFLRASQTLTFEKRNYAGIFIQVLPPLLETGLSPDRGLSLFQSVAPRASTKLGNSIYSALKSIPAAICGLKASGLGLDEIVDGLLKASEIAGNSMDDAFALLPLALGANPSMPPSQALAKTLDLVRILSGVTNPLFEEFIALVRLNRLNPLSIVDRSSLVEWVAAAAVQGYESVPESDKPAYFEKLANLINHLHDCDPFLKRVDHQDGLRLAILKKLSLGDLHCVYELIAYAGGSLYPSSFKNLYDFLKKNRPNFVNEIVVSVDPQGLLLERFIINVAGFSKFEEVYGQNPGFFNPYVLGLLSVADSSDLTRNVMLLQRLAGEIFTKQEYAAFRPDLENFLVTSFLKASRYTDPSLSAADRLEMKCKLACYGYLIRLYAPSMEGPAIPGILASLPSVDIQRIPTAWTRDGALSVKQYFYNDENSYWVSQAQFRAFGFNPGPRQADGSVLMTKTVGNVRLEVAFILRPTDEVVDIGQDLKDPAIDGVVHRGHIYNQKRTFPPTEEGHGQEKWIVSGGCVSWETLPELMASYSGNHIITDRDVGLTHDNDALLFYSMEAIAKGKSDWSEVRNYVGARHSLGGTGFVFPDDPSVALYDFVSEVEKANIFVL